MMLAKRPCHLRESDHKYIWQPTGEQMATSVTGVRDYFKDPDRFQKIAQKYEEGSYTRWWVDNCSEIGTHNHRALEALANQSIEMDICKEKEAEGDELAWEASPEAWLQFMDHHGTESPEGHECSPWIDHLVSMTSFWDQVEVLATEYTMVHRRKSLGGQADLICVFKDKAMLVDLKSKSANWKFASKDDELSYRQQFGGYLYLLTDGDNAGGGQMIDLCQTLIVTPNGVKWLPPYDPDDCYSEWEECWKKYSAALSTQACPF